MSAIGSITSRTTLLMSGDALLAALQKTQSAINKDSAEISSGQAVQKPSDSPQNLPAILQVQAQLKARDQYDNNLTFATGVLNTTDQSLADAYNTLVQAQSVGSSQIGVGSDQTTPHNEATVIDGQIQALLNIANTQYQGVSVFGGNSTPSATSSGGNPFMDFMGGIRYLGSRQNLTTASGTASPLTINSNGDEAFGALPVSVAGADLQPNATGATRIADVGGAVGQGVTLGTVEVTIDGTNVDVDLTGSATLGDITKRINAAISGVSPGAGALAVPGTATGFSLTAAPGHSITIADIGGGRAATDLGIGISASGGAVSGGDVNTKLTMQTAISSLGVPVDLTSGMQVTQGATTVTVSFAGAATIQDLNNIIKKQNLGLHLEINSAGNGLNLVSEVSGVDLSVGEDGGTTASDLGLRTLGAATALSSLNLGQGLTRTAGQDDFSVQLHNGTTFDVNLDGAATVGDALAKISASATAAGLTVGTPGQAGTDFNLGLASTGNGLVLEDGTSGASDFKVTQLGTSLAATGLGINADAASGNQIAGQDVGKVQNNSVFTDLMNLRDALAKNDTSGITVATSALESDINRVTEARAEVGVRAQRVQQQTQSSSDMRNTENQMLSGLRDTDMTTVITQFTQLEQQLQASLEVASKTMQTSLLDYLR